MAEILTRWALIVTTITLCLFAFRCAVDGLEPMPDAATEDR